jgi:hypothetical protein
MGRKFVILYGVLQHGGPRLQGGRHLIENILGCDDDRVLIADASERVRAVVVAVAVADEHQLGRGNAGERGCAADGVVVDRLAIPLHDEAGVVDRVDQHVASGGVEKVASEGAGREGDGTVVASGHGTGAGMIEVNAASRRHLHGGNSLPQLQVAGKLEPLEGAAFGFEM